MCISTHALFLFASLLASDIVTWTPDRVVIEAEVATVFWDRFEEDWCTAAPFHSQTMAALNHEHQIMESSPF